MTDARAPDHPGRVSGGGSFAPRDPGAHPPALAPDYLSTQARAPRHAPLRLPHGAGEAAAPAFDASALGPLDADLTRNHAAARGLDTTAIGERIVVHGRVLGTDARPLPGVLIEIWQANAGGRYAHVNDGYLAPLDPAFGGCGRCVSDAEGRYAFLTVRPGPYPWPNGGSAWRPAHIHLSLFGAGICQRLVTQLYFEGDPLIRRCPIVQSVPDDRAVARLTARLDMENQRPFDALAYRFDVVLRGRGQTPFESRPEGL